MPKPVVQSTSAKILQRYQQMRIRRDGWRRIFALLSKYILMRPIWFGDTGVPWCTPILSVAGVSDDTTVDVARTSATALGGALWPNTAETFEIVPRMPPSVEVDLDLVYKSEEVKTYFEQVTRIVRDVIDAPESGFHIAWAEYLDDQIVYGTSGIYGEENDLDEVQPIRYHSASIETSVIDESASGLIDTVYFEHVFTARQLVEKYGYDEVSQKTRAMFDGGKQDDYLKVIQAIEPRPEGVRGGRIDNKPYASIHMEYDSKKILKVSGIEEMPVFMTRFRKRPNELYGRSLAMDALPTVKELNVLRRAYSLALEKILDPPLGYYPEFLGGGSQLNVSAGSKTPLYANSRAGVDIKSPIFQLYTINEPQNATQRITELMGELRIKFLLDRLLDFNSEQRMTLGEVEKREGFRNLELGNVFSRQIIELLNPLIKWTVQVLWRRGLLGLHPVKDADRIAKLKFLGRTPLVIPTVIAALVSQGQTPFLVRFISPAARAMKAESLNGIEKLTNYLLALHNVGITDAFDNIDSDQAVRMYQDLCGAPLQVINGTDKMKKVREARQKQLAEMQKFQSAEQQAVIQDKQAKAAKNYSQAGQNGMMQPPGGAPNAA